VDNGYVPDSYTARYGPSLQVLLRHDAQELAAFIHWLKQFTSTFRHEDNAFVAYHGGPNNPETEYLYPDTVLPEADSPLVFTGHTHYPMCRTHNGAIFCNPGSLGQPRNGGPATFALVDTASAAQTWRLYPVAFDREAFLASLADFEPFPPRMREMLKGGL
jgi:diadenosine tetraphosphatase ApaH/serine/threonine PP2A family protein phosphatase